MNIPDPSTPSGAPPFIPPGASPLTPAGEAPLGSNSLEQTPIHGIFPTVDALLRQPRRVMFQLRGPNAGNLITLMLLISVVCAVVYGVVVGTYSGQTQLWAAPVKIAGGLLISSLICLPSLYIFSCMGGAQTRLLEVLGLVAGLLTLMTLLLLAFAPVALVFSTSTKSLAAMGALHLIFWFVATVFGLRFLYAGFRHFNAQSHAGLNVWIIIFLMVALQMSTAIRPIIGKSDHFLPQASDKKFFLVHWLEQCSAEPWEKPATPDGQKN